MKGLDRWLTIEPDNGWDNFCEMTLNLVPNEFYNENEKFFDSDDCNHLLNKLFNSEKSPKRSVEILMRLIKLYKL